MQTTTVHSTTATAPSAGLWTLAWRRLTRNKVAMISLAIVILFLVMGLLSATGLIVKDWNKEVAVSYAPPTFLYDAKQSTHQTDSAIRRDPTLAETQNIESYGVSDPIAAQMSIVRDEMQNIQVEQTTLKNSLPLGADRWGQDIIKKTIKASETSIIVGLFAAVFAVILGTVLGAISGYFGGWLDDVINWFYNIFNSIPYMLLILAIAAVLQQKGVLSIILILGLTGWTGTYRLVRAEYMKHASREYVMAAKAIGARPYQRMFHHILPNIAHVPLVQMSILVVGFIKSEVILSFLGFGVPVGTVSWGSMLNEAPSEFILGKWEQLLAATTAMAILVTAFSLFTDALRDALDPKIK